MELIKQCIEDLKNTDAVIIDCQKCNHNTFIGVGQGFSNDGKSYPIGNCCICDMNLRNLDDSTDVILMTEFRNVHWDDWVKFCMEKGYRPLVKGD